MNTSRTVLQKIQHEQIKRREMELDAKREAYKKEYWRNFKWMAVLGPIVFIGAIALYVLVAGL